MTKAELKALNTLTITQNTQRSIKGQVLHDLNDQILTDVVTIDEIIDVLTSTETNKPASANTVKQLKDLIDLLQGSLIPQGNWNADTNTPDISTETATGKFWIVSVAGSTDIGGITDWKVNDWVIKTETGWAKIDNTDKITSVNGKVGVVELEASDIDISDTEDYYNATNIEDAFKEIGETKYINGFDLQTPDSLGTIDISGRTVSLEVKSGQPNFYFWVNGKKIIKTTTQSVTIPDTTGAYYIYFDNSGTLQQVAEDSMPIETIYQYALVALVYWNATQGESRVGNEQHGIRMSASTHAYNHLTYGARYDGNDGLMDIEGLTNNGELYSQTTSGHFWDEDKRHAVDTETTHPYLYRLGATGEWTTSSINNRLAIKENDTDTYYAWNEWTGSTWKLTQGTASTDYWILFFVAMPSISGNKIVKLLGQNAYPSRNNARNAIEKEIDNIVTDGLPNPEFIFLYAVIVNRNGKLQKLADGSLFYDLRKLKGASGGTGSSTSYASDIPTDTSNFDGALSSDDDNVQKALETLDDAVDDKANKNNVLELNNTTSFTPDNDYEPATKKYVDDNIGTSGTWTATTTNSTNCSSSSVIVARYSRQGDIVTFDIKGGYDPNSSATTRFYVSLPIASNFSSVNDAIGVVTGVKESGVIEASTTFNSLYIIVTGNNTASHSFNAHGSYKIIT